MMVEELALFLCCFQSTVAGILRSASGTVISEAITAMVQQAMQYIDETSDIETKIELIKTLNSVSAEKIYVEIERTRLIKRLAKVKEEQGQIAEAMDLMQEIAVRLCLDRQDYVRAQILSRMISPRVFDVETPKAMKPKGESIVEEAPADIPLLLELKRIYYELMIRLSSSTKFTNTTSVSPFQRDYINILNQ